jgi:succinyl-diaminopimelate desuccinylase
MSDFYIKDIIVNYNNHDNHNLLISNVETTDFDVLFSGHVDVVKNDEYKATIIKRRLYGRGAIDMKGQVAVMMEILKNTNTSKKIGLLLTSDEEVGGFCCQTIAKDLNAKIVIMPDGGKNFDLIVEEKGLAQLEITSTGVSSHGSEPFNGDNAIVKLMNLYNDLISIYPIPKSKDDWRLSVTLSTLNGGDANNKVPAYATMTLDIRYTSNDNINRIINYIRNYSENITLKVLDIEPVFYLNQELDIVKEFIKSTEKILNNKIVITRCSAGSDAPYFSNKEIPVIIMNPIGDYWHNPNEYAEIDSYYMLYKIFKSIL